MLNKNYKHLQIYLSFSPNSTLEIKMKESDIKRLIQLLKKAAHVRIEVHLLFSELKLIFVCNIRYIGKLCRVSIDVIS